MVKKRGTAFIFHKESIVSIIINSIGAFMTFLYFNVIDPAPTGENGLHNLEPSSYIIFISILVSFFVVGINWGNRYKKTFKKWYSMIDSGEISPHDVPQKVKRDVLNFPLYAAGIAAMMWFPSSILAAVVTRSFRVFIGLFGWGGSLAVVLLYFVDDLLWRPIIPVFFPEGNVSEAKAFQIPVFWKLLIILLFTGILLPILLVILTWQRVHMMLTVANPELVLQNLRQLQIFILSTGVVAGVGLAFFITRGITKPLEALRSAMERIRENDLEAKVIVSTNDEVGYLGERFNQMTAELRQKDILFNANIQLKDQLSKIKTLEAALREQAIRDPLTGLFNRRYLSGSLEQEFQRVIRQKSHFSVVMLDLDRLKEINDVYGHVEGGDQCLVTLANTLKGLCRSEDTICRYAGDEFVVLLYDTPAKTAQKRALQWKDALLKSKLIARDKVMEFTFSAGIAEYSPQQKSADELLKCADRALYRAKEKGRNRVEVYNSPR